MLGSFPTIAQTGGGVIGIWGLFIIALVTLAKAWPVLRKVQADSDASLRSDLLQRVDELESEVRALRQAFDRERDRHAMVEADLRHDLNNETASFDAFLLLAEANPEKVLEQIPRIKEMRSAHRDRVAVKRGYREGAKMAGGDE